MRSMRTIWLGDLIANREAVYIPCGMSFVHLTLAGIILSSSMVHLTSSLEFEVMRPSRDASDGVPGPCASTPPRVRALLSACRDNHPVTTVTSTPPRHIKAQRWSFYILLYTSHYYILGPTYPTMMSAHPESTSSHPSAGAPDPTITSTSAASNAQSIINIGTRRSKLALIQAELVRKKLAEHPDNKGREFKIHAMATMGDKNQVTPLHSFGAKALWTFELEDQLLGDKKELDIIVHCLKDMPTQLPAGARIGAIMKREDPRDAVVMKPGLPYKGIADLPKGSVVGTSSVRRSAQIARNYPGLKFKDVRGNVGTRLAKLDDPEGEYSCLILAAAGLIRVGEEKRITELLSSSTPGGGMLHSVGQGALAIEIREGDAIAEELCTQLADEGTTLCTLAERSLMRELEGGCSVPIGVESSYTKEKEQKHGKVTMRAIVVNLDGTEAVEATGDIEVKDEKDAEELGRVIAENLLAHGAGQILNKILLNRKLVEEDNNA